MMCDIIYASKTAKFGQPEIKLGTIPGMGGSQRLTHAIGKSKAMELILSGRNLSAADALKFGLVAEVFEEPALCITGALDLAEEIGGFSPMAVAAAKEAVNVAFQEGLKLGLETERRLFWGSFATVDRKIGMDAFVKKEKPKWENQ